ncbi:MAG: transcription termination/antitermination protein NusG [Dehalococcoidia bacterium]
MVTNQKEWYVIHTYAGYEERIKKNLEHRIESMDASDKIFEVIIPTEEEIEIRDGQRRTVAKKVFPGYILVNMILTNESWYVVRNTPGVTGFVSSGDPPKPAPLEPKEVKIILGQLEGEKPKVRVGFTKGQSIRITDGPFSDFIGVVEEMHPDKGKVKVLVSFFGRDTPVELDFLQVEKL